MQYSIDQKCSTVQVRNGIQYISEMQYSIRNAEQYRSDMQDSIGQKCRTVQIRNALQNRSNALQFRSEMHYSIDENAVQYR